MKKAFLIILSCCIISSLFVGCGSKTVEQPQTSPTLTLGNPWSNMDSIEEAETEVGFSFGLPEVIADSYNIVGIRTMNKELLEVLYLDGSFEVCVRKQAGEGQDISGDYNKYETCSEINQNGGTITTYRNSENSAVKQIISYNGYSWSLVAPEGYREETNSNFLNAILK